MIAWLFVARTAAFVGGVDKVVPGMVCGESAFLHPLLLFFNGLHIARRRVRCGPSLA